MTDAILTNVTSTLSTNSDDKKVTREKLITLFTLFY